MFCLFKTFFQVSNHYFLELGNKKHTAIGLSIYHLPHIVKCFSFMICFSQISFGIYYILINPLQFHHCPLVEEALSWITDLL